MKEHVEAFLAALAARNDSPNTLRAYRADLDELLAFAKGNVFDRKLVRDFLAHLNGRDLKRSSVARKLAAVKSLSKWLVGEGLIEQDVAHAIRPPRIPKQIPPVPSEEQMTTLLDGDPSSAFPLRDRLIIELLYSTGCRVDELAGVNVDDFYSHDALLIRGKGRKQRYVIFGEYAAAALKAYLPERAKLLERQGVKTRALLVGLTNWRVGRLTTRQIDRIVKAACTAKGLPRFHSHCFRHAFATHMIDHDAPIVHVSKLMGHKKLSTTMRYVHLSPSMMMKVYERAHPHAATAVV